MKLTVVKCDRCGTVHDNQDDKKFENRTYIGVDERFHFCKECATHITLYDFIAVRVEKVRGER
jgi:RNase P subunit RPR2